MNKLFKDVTVSVVGSVITAALFAIAALLWDRFPSALEKFDGNYWALVILLVLLPCTGPSFLWAAVDMSRAFVNHPSSEFEGWRAYVDIAEFLFWIISFYLLGVGSFALLSYLFFF